MRIRFIQTVSTSREVFRRGKDFDLPDVEAAPFIRNGVAVDVATADDHATPEAAEATAAAVAEVERLRGELRAQREQFDKSWATAMDERDQLKAQVRNLTLEVGRIRTNLANEALPTVATDTPATDEGLAAAPPVADRVTPAVIPPATAPKRKK